MAGTTRSRVVELSEHNSTQVATFWFLVVASSATLFLFVASPLLALFFQTFLRSEVIRDGREVSYQISENRADERVTTGLLTTWALVDPRSVKAAETVALLEGRPAPPVRAEFIFKPVLALAPLVVVGGFVIAALLSMMFPGGYLRQKIEREILLALDRVALGQFGEHTPQEIAQLSSNLTKADARKLHDMADTYGMAYSDIDLLRRALLWRDAPAGSQLMRAHDALKFYMRVYFTERYSNAVLGFVYIGAAVLIIVIGIRGLKFLPASDPSIVLSALGLEFMLLITYAAVLMYGRTDESTEAFVSSEVRASGAPAENAETERLLRAFLAISRNTKSGEVK